MATLRSLNVGRPKDVPWRGRTVHTGAWKHPVDGPLMVRRLNVDGDGQGDLQGHGWEQRAVLVYQTQSYAYWRKVLERDDLEFGQFGENFTVDGLADDEVCIGDRYRIGEAEFEVTQPRVTCYRVGMRLNEPRMASLLVAHHRPGFYLRVITEGRVRAGDRITRTRTGRGSLTVADTDALLYLPDPDPARLRAALAIEALSPGWQQSFQEMSGRLDQPPGPAPAAPGWTGFRQLRVTHVVPETPTVPSFHLRAADSQELPLAAPGQYLTVRIPGDGRPGLVRSYSLSSAPDTAEYRISVKREDHGTASTWLHTHLHRGDVIEAAAPRGTFVLADEHTPVALFSAGIGVTPVLAMLYRLALDHSSRAVWWVHTARDPGQQPFAEEARQLLARLPQARALIYYTAPDLEIAEGPGITHGRMTSEGIRELGIPADAHAYLCGPEGFMSAVTSGLQLTGLNGSNIHTEVFGALAAINPGITHTGSGHPHQPPGPRGTGPSVTFTRSGLSTGWSDRYATLLELAEACDVPTRWSCRTGVCHTCATPLLTGQVEYTTQPLEDPAPGEALPCCSIPTTDVLLDL
ncbi:MOSC and FAD-binding oxidoreductase domain-containing protein [Streptomyces sp. NBC_01728]|uniref:MOSC and FAD-binding oxidoreductase domain-containing protein n=1 Tax=unclassified Streptomyces TaxID=2593676 RepID=UPI0022504F67|nr:MULTISPECIES: MOSC and FAD-binding oxidoreductase domain-containing protein [unclassified Streptomyces]MCX4462102.1 MOSC and FAD-binding oxidoreductase domain-containing protein [Streptomyces sp. NBC_01719]MCX4491010.1 MOSC and FAD-binding oxidoreductase domain-containing protein [Streptomyces sp. NBC_01728]